MGRGRDGGGGSGGAPKGGTGSPNSSPDVLNDKGAVDGAANADTAKDAASQLGLPGKDAAHFETGANATASKLSNASDPAAALSAFKLAVKAYERKHGRYAARAYSRGGYWSLLRAIRTALAVTATVTQAPAAPALAAANAALIASYWLTR